MRTIFELFAKSPFEPLARHAGKVHTVVEEIRPLTEAFLDEEWDRVEELYREISRLEHQADEIKAEIRDHLPKSLFLPVDRGDILKFLKEQDGIADAVEDLAVVLSMRRTRGTDELEPKVLRLVEQVEETAATWYEVARELPSLQEASFTGPEVQKVLDLVAEVGDQEWEADKRQSEASRALVEQEDELGPVSVLFWMKIFERVGAIANHCENTADLIRLMLSRS